MGTYRDVELDVSRPLADALRQLVRERLAERMSLRRLPEAGTAALVEILCGQQPSPSLTERLHGETEGNAFFLEEVVEHLREEGRLFDERGQLRSSLDVEDLEVPESVRLVIGRRLERLDEASQEVLTIAAVLGRRFDFGLLEEVHGGDTEVVLDALDQAESLKLVMNEATSRRRARFAFAHELIRHTLTSNLTLPRRQRLHKRCADALERSHADQPERVTSALAHHLYQSGGFADDAKTRRFLVEAGRQALASMAFEEALDSFARTDDLEDVAPADRSQVTAESAELALLRSEALKGLGRFPEVVAELSRALPYYEEVGDEVVVAEICREGSYFLGWNAHPTKGLEMVERGLRLAGGASTHRCRLLSIGGLVASFGGNRVRGEEYFAEAKSIARQLNDTYLEGDRLAWEIWYYHFYMLVDEARNRAQAAMDRLAENEKAFDLGFLLGILSVGHGMAGDFERMDEVVARHQQLSERLGGFSSFHIEQGRSRVAWCRTGDLDQREENALVMREIIERMGVPWFHEHLVQVALVRFCQGRWDEAMSFAQKAYRHDARVVDSPLRGGGRAVLMLIASFLGDRDQAERLIAEAKPDLPSSGVPNPQCCWFTVFSLVESLNLLDEDDRAGALYPLCAEALQTGTVVDWWGRALVQRVAGVAAANAGEWRRAEEHFETALRQAHELPFLSEQPEVRWWFAKMLRERRETGDSDRADALLREAAAGYREIGMPRHVAMVEETLGQA